jgi:hypothetical protein
MMQRHLRRLTQQLGLSDDQRTQVQALLRNHAKEIIRLQADIATMQSDVRQQRDVEPVDLLKVKPLVQAIAAEEVELRLSHITTMQEISKLLTPGTAEDLPHHARHIMEDGGMTGHGGMMGGMMGPGSRVQ